MEAGQASPQPWGERGLWGPSGRRVLRPPQLGFPKGFWEEAVEASGAGGTCPPRLPVPTPPHGHPELRWDSAAVETRLPEGLTWGTWGTPWEGCRWGPAPGPGKGADSGGRAGSWPAPPRGSLGDDGDWTGRERTQCRAPRHRGRGGEPRPTGEGKGSRDPGLAERRPSPALHPCVRTPEAGALGLRGPLHTFMSLGSGRIPDDLPSSPVKK